MYSLAVVVVDVVLKWPQFLFFVKKEKFLFQIFCRVIEMTVFNDVSDVNDNAVADTDAS